MKLLTAPFSLLAVVSTAYSLAITARGIDTMLQIRDDNICRAVPKPVSGAPAAVCQISHFGGTCGGCDIMWASYNVCKCGYQPARSNEECRSLLDNAVRHIFPFQFPCQLLSELTGVTDHG